jgi:hypothetical protein
VNDAADLPLPGTLATVEITEAKHYDLIGRAIEFEAPKPESSRRQTLAPASPFVILA